jgi:5-methyltetrahydrofolate--homocysteine methyltransferase
MADLKQLTEAVISGNAAQSKELTQKAMDEGVPVQQILDDGLIAGMNEVGVRFKSNVFYVPEVLIAARAMNQAMELLEPELAKAGIEPVGTVVLGTVKGDLHDIGKNLVGMMWKGAGFKVIDLNVDVAPEKFVEAVKESDAKLLGLSALLTTTMVSMKDVLEALDAAGLKGKVKTMVGGAPVTQEYADEIGADGYAPDAASAVEKAKELLGL